MTLPASGIMTAAMINAELGRASNAAFSMNGSAERGLAGKPSGLIKMSDFYGKSNVPPDTHNMTAGYDAGGWTGWWYAHMGSGSPTTLNTAQITWIMDGSGMFTVSVFSTQAQNFFNKIYVNGKVFDTANASFSLPSGQSRWDWSGQSAGFVNGSSYPMSIV